jgi:hypothetical protein
MNKDESPGIAILFIRLYPAHPVTGIFTLSGEPIIGPKVS